MAQSNGWRSVQTTMCEYHHLHDGLLLHNTLFLGHFQSGRDKCGLLSIYCSVCVCATCVLCCRKLQQHVAAVQAELKAAQAAADLEATLKEFKAFIDNGQSTYTPPASTVHSRPFLSYQGLWQRQSRPQHVLALTNMRPPGRPA